MKNFSLRLLSLLVIGVAFGVGCSGSSNPTPTPTPIQTSVQTLSLGTTPASFALGPIFSGVAATGQFPATTSGSGSATLTLTGIQPGNTPAMASRLRKPQDLGTTSANAIAYIVITLSTTVALQSTPQLIFTIPSGISAPNGFWLASFSTSNPSLGWNVIAGPSMASNNIVTFESLPVPITLTSGVTYVIALIAPGGTFPPAVGVGGTLAPPVIAGVETTPLLYHPNAPATAITSTLTVSDPSSTTLSSAIVKIIYNYQQGQDVLAGGAAVSGITVGAFDAATGSITLSGTASLASYQTALRGITYVDTSSSPVITYRKVSFELYDGVHSSNMAFRYLNVS